MRALILGAALASVVGLGVAHAEFPFKANEAHKELNKAARGLDVDARFERQKPCTHGVKTVCQYSTDSEAIGVLVSADTPDGVANSVTVIFVPDGDESTSAYALVTWGVVMVTVKPDLPKRERGEVFRALMPAVERKSSERIAKGDVQFSLTFSDVIGLWFSAGPVGSD